MQGATLHVGGISRFGPGDISGPEVGVRKPDMIHTADDIDMTRRNETGPSHASHAEGPQDLRHTADDYDYGLRERSKEKNVQNVTESKPNASVRTADDLAFGGQR